MKMRTPYAIHVLAEALRKERHDQRIFVRAHPVSKKARRRRIAQLEDAISVLNVYYHPNATTL
jgi:hypothetical protein